MSDSYGPRERIRKKSDFSALYQRGRSFRSRYFTIVYLSNGLGYPRMAAVSSRKVGNAVRRNRARRRARELFRRNKESLKMSLDMLLITRAECADAPWPQLCEQYAAFLASLAREKSLR
ncbi:MAG: ribonuclease P protein component [Acidobacteriota bacterium]|jgi:ribonuclease P protein component|nr:ribonuclease P protein component [Acidobacteriota bacterium]OQB56844.1 MAG: Ribonuclease P protein component [Candidatus Aminicenantes bacterium ADurb.Bin147]HNQ81373.1 ribonuclease P protein component [Candidatus Aminicenantes bacterium]MDD8030357.1 ribonuclease P protein component [Acidobacteriota bacterium]MDD8032633.1 ribonuclease P protein component [Acidobacteriota bacterium]